MRPCTPRRRAARALSFQVRPIVTEIEQIMTIPLIQGTLRYAYKNEMYTTSSTDTVKYNAEGAVFAMAVLPYLHACSAADAQTVYDNMKFGVGTSTNKAAVKAAFEANYACLGITCADVGAYAGTMPCGDPCPTDDDDDDLLDGGLREVMSLAPMGLAAIGITFTGITIATLVNLAQEQCALGPTIIFEAGTTHPYYITPNLCTIGAHTYSSKKTVRDASPRKVCRKYCEEASDKLALKHVQGLTCYCKKK